DREHRGDAPALGREREQRAERDDREERGAEDQEDGGASLPDRISEAGSIQSAGERERRERAREHEEDDRQRGREDGEAGARGGSGGVAAHAREQSRSAAPRQALRQFRRGS